MTTDPHLTIPETILCALLTLSVFACFLTGTLDLAVWVAWKVRQWTQ